MDCYTVMIVDGGARGHVLSKAYENDVDRIIVAPGNGFIAYNREKEVLIEKCDMKDPLSILVVAEKYKPALIDVAQDDALAGGTVNLLTKHGYPTFGPTKEAAEIEWNKKRSREFMQRNGIPAPKFHSFDSEKAGMEHAEAIYRENPAKVIFVKAAGLCAGKGALKARTYDEAIKRIEQMKKFGEAGKTYLIEEGITGEEFSQHAISDGNTFRLFKSAQDNKLSGNFDEGYQTGGMGSNAPAMVTRDYAREIEDNQIGRAIKGMREEGNPFRGILYLGGMAGNGIGNIEFNARWGDPEVQSILPGVDNYLELVLACLEGGLADVKIQQDDDYRVCVVGASRGYPNDYSNVKGKRIYGLEEVMELEGMEVFGAGIDVKGNKFYANGGRLFSIVGKGKDVLKAKRKANTAMALVDIEGNNLLHRDDIAWRDVERYLKEIG